MARTVSQDQQNRRNAPVAIIGAGPIGLELAANFRRYGISYLHFEAGRMGETIARWPAWTPFFSSPERVAIAGVPLQSVHQNMLTGEEYLAYLRAVVEQYDLPILSEHRIIGARTLEGGGFELESDYRGRISRWRVEKLILAHGNMHEPRRLGIPGEDLEHVEHHYRDVHRFFRRDLLIVGGRNSAVEAAIRCYRAGARVTLMHRRGELDARRLNSRYHLEISILIDKGKIRFIPSAELVEIRRDSVAYRDPAADGHGSAGSGDSTGATRDLDADFVMLCLGFSKDTSLHTALGIPLDEDGSPRLNESTMETPVPGLYLAGTAAGGTKDSYGIFVGTSHVHVERIIADICGEPAIVGDGGGRHYPFARRDIEPTEGKA
jgi:thioredoxin reductase (NADPH)